MQILKFTTQKAQNFVAGYSKSQITSIYQAYSRPSDLKIGAYERIRRRAIESNAATPVYIISAGCQYFSTAYECLVDGVCGLVVDTFAQTYFIPWEIEVEI